MNWLLGPTTALVALVLSYFHQGVSNVVGDLFGAMPIAKEAAFPGLYPAQDLIVAAGMRGPFHIYKSAGWLYRWGADVDLVWFFALLSVLFLTFLALWHLSVVATGNHNVASFAVLFLSIASPWRGALNWTPVPIPFLVTSTFALPVGLLSLALFLNQRHLAALLAAAVMFNIHPSAIILLVLIGSHILIRETALPLSRRLLWLGTGALLSLPNALYTLYQLPGNFLATATVAPAFFTEQFRIFAYHAFIEDHWREGYGWFLLNGTAATFLLRYLDPRKRNLIVYTFAILLGMLVVYVLNLYLFQNRSLMLLFLFRVTFFLKPLMVIVVTYGLYRWSIETNPSSLRRSGIRYAVVAGFSFSLLTGDIVQSEALLLLSIALLFLSTVQRGTALRALAFITVCLGLAELTVMLIIRHLPIHADRLWTDFFLIYHFAAGAAFLFTLLRSVHTRAYAALPVQAHAADEPVKRGRILAILVLLLIVPKMSTAVRAYVRADHFLQEQLALRAYFSNPAPSLAPLVQWAREHTRRAALFAVPPIDPGDGTMYAQFRVAAERGIYITLFDIYQLAYDVRMYREGIDRLSKLGFKVLGRHRFDDSAYHDMSPAALKRLREEDHVDYAVFEKARLGTSLQRMTFCFENEWFAVLDLRTIR